MYYPNRSRSSSEWLIASYNEFSRTQIVPDVKPLEKVDPANPTATTTTQNVVNLRVHQEHAKARFRMLRRLRENHDGEGAGAAVRGSVDHAIAFLDRHSFSLPILSTLDDDGLAVIEIHSPEFGVFADITFEIDGTIECYYRQNDEPSQMIRALPSDPVAKTFLSQFDVR